MSESHAPAAPGGRNRHLFTTVKRIQLFVARTPTLVVEAIPMKAFATLGTAVLFLSLGTIVPAFAQHEQEEARPEQEHAQQQNQNKQAQQQQAKQQNQNEQAQQQQAKQQNQNEQAQQQNQNKQAQQQQANQQNQNKQQQQQQAKQQNQNKQAQQQQAKQQNQNEQQQAQQQGVQQPAQHTQEQQRVQQAAWQGHRSQNWQSDHRTWQQRGGYNGYRIPDNRYNGYFGPDHGFVIYSQPYMVVGGFPRFQYSGYWFTLVDPWPSYWANNWYQTDNVYVV